MLSVMKEANKPKKKDKKLIEEVFKPKDIIIEKVYEQTEDLPNGDRITRRKKKLVNITKLVNETKKAIKTESASQKIADMKRELINKGVL